MAVKVVTSVDSFLLRLLLLRQQAICQRVRIVTFATLTLLSVHQSLITRVLQVCVPRAMMEVRIMSQSGRWG